MSPSHFYAPNHNREDMTSIAESHSPKHQPPRSPNPSSGISGRRRSTDRESTNMQQNTNAASSSGSRYVNNIHVSSQFITFVISLLKLKKMVFLDVDQLIIHFRSSQSTKILTHQMSSGALTAALGRSNRDRDITDLVPSAPECSYAACFCEVCISNFYILIC